MDTIDLNNLRDRAYKCACDHGFHDEELSNEHFLMLVLTELSEAVEADRLNRHADKLGFDTGISNAHQGVVRDDWFTYCYNRCIKRTVEEELADAVIRLLDLAGLRRISFEMAQKDMENYIDDMVYVCEDETFTESIYSICTLPTRYNYIYEFPTVVNDMIRFSMVVNNMIRFSMVVNNMILCILGLARHLDIDLLWHIEQKMKYNESRGYKHGKLY